MHLVYSKYFTVLLYLFPWYLLSSPEMIHKAIFEYIGTGIQFDYK